MSLVRENLMKDHQYRPHCGNLFCGALMPRTVWTGTQFKCYACHWISRFPDDFIAEYKAKHGLGDTP